MIQYFLFCATIFTLGSFVETNLVRARQGKLIGTTWQSQNGNLFSVYLGIPFAKPPLGKLRFQPPVKADPWKGIFNATKIPDPCVQCKPRQNITFGKEDCLTLNVYTPLNSTNKDNFPVIVYIYGGIFKQGSSIHNGPQYMMDKDIIIVMPNHRLGALGYLSTGDNVIAGNMGLKDQVLALKWVQENIRAFGGDKNRITLQGHSSGAISVHLHTLSPLSKGLFNRVIIQSGSAFSCGGAFDEEVSASIARELSSLVGCAVTSSEEILNCLMSVKGEELLIKQWDLFVWRSYPDAAFRPAVEAKTVKNAFLNEFPIKCSYQSSDIEMLIGMTSGEESFVAGEFLENEGVLAEVNNYYGLIFPITLQYLWTAKPESRDFISVILKKHYFGNEDISEESASAITKMYTQQMYGGPTNEAVRRLPGKKYVYLFDYVSGFTLHQQFQSFGKFYGISHADELPLLFNIQNKSSYLSPKDHIFGKEMITRWINFAYSGNPNEPYPINETIFGFWNHVRSERIEFLRLKMNGSMESNFFLDEYKFWKSLPIFSKFY